MHGYSEEKESHSDSDRQGLLKDLQQAQAESKLLRARRKTLIKYSPGSDSSDRERHAWVLGDLRSAVQRQRAQTDRLQRDNLALLSKENALNSALTIVKERLEDVSTRRKQSNALFAVRQTAYLEASAAHQSSLGMSLLAEIAGAQTDTACTGGRDPKLARHMEANKDSAAAAAAAASSMHTGAAVGASKLQQYLRTSLQKGEWQ